MAKAVSDPYAEIREAAEADLETFIRVVSPGRVLGGCHKDLIRWWSREEAKDHQLVLFPRDHGKSAMVAYRVAWKLTKDPTLRILYISATSTLAQKQLGFIKQIFESDIHRRLWPLHIHPEEGKRAKWTQSEIELDHPLRKEEQVRDPSIFTAGLNTGITGLHFDIAVLDDIVVKENATTQEGRDKVSAQYSLLASIEGTGSQEWVVGTRYHPKDLYDTMLNMKEPVFDEEGEIISEEPIYEILERSVEDRGDGTGQFLWPRQQRKDGKWFGFDMKELARKKAKYQDKLQFRAQYYNDPSDPDSQPINPSLFQYWEGRLLKDTMHGWMYNGRRLNLVAAIDFAYSTRARADYTAIVVTGTDENNNIFVLEIDRFKETTLKGYFDHILRLSNKWGFKKLVAETTAAQAAIVRSLKQDYFATHGLMIKVEEVKPTRHEGSKEERLEAILTPRYENQQVFHYKGGNTQVLEEELVMKYPPHDDVKDALANAISFSVKPAKGMRQDSQSTVVFHPKFGGVIG
jgi:hypothetical protein